jgi:hypothetical protein
MATTATLTSSATRTRKTSFSRRCIGSLSMPPRFPNLEPLRSFPKHIEADCYNHVRLALKRLSRPLRLALPDHRGLEVVLDDDGWLIVDSLQADQPVLAWVDFNHRRDSLHEPVECVLKLYHVHAGLVMGTALEALDKALAGRLTADS